MHSAREPGVAAAERRRRVRACASACYRGERIGSWSSIRVSSRHHGFMPPSTGPASMQRQAYGRLPCVEFPTPGGVKHSQGAVLRGAAVDDQATIPVRTNSLVAWVLPWAGLLLQAIASPKESVGEPRGGAAPDTTTKIAHGTGQPRECRKRPAPLLSASGLSAVFLHSRAPTLNARQRDRVHWRAWALISGVNKPLEESGSRPPPWVGSRA